LLLRSGIGPVEDLRALGIAVAADLPGVGANLHDHPTAALVFEVRGRTLNQDVTPGRLLRHAADFALRGRGAITSTSNHAVVFDRLDPSSPVPQAELIFMAFGLAAAGEDDAPGDEGTGGTLRRFTARSGGSEAGRRQAAAAPLVTAQAALLQPHSRGRLSIAAADPNDPPRISFDLLGDDRDVAGLTAAARRIRRIFEAPALARRVVSERKPGAVTGDDGAWEGYIRETAFRLCHPVGTCAMGTGPSAVVSPALRVHGVDGLRVIDASVMPVITTGNTMAPTIMIAERGSDLVRGLA